MCYLLREIGHLRAAALGYGEIRRKGKSYNAYTTKCKQYRVMNSESRFGVPLCLRRAQLGIAATLVPTILVLDVIFFSFLSPSL